jgi:TonB family protein
MKIYLFFALIFLTISGHSQNDTTLYFSNLNKAITSKKDASIYYELKKEKRGNFTLHTFQMINKKWQRKKVTIIQKESDSSYTTYTKGTKKQQFTRFYLKTDSGYQIRDFLNNILIDEGISQTIFPTIRNGLWKQYNHTDGKLKTESIYSDNQLITNKVCIPDGTYINDVFIFVDKYPVYEGGNKELLKFISQNIKYPQLAKDRNISGKVIITFILMKDGSIRGIDFLQRLHSMLELEAIRGINLIPKNKWTPAEIDGQKVNIHMMIPITFNLSQTSNQLK